MREILKNQSLLGTNTEYDLGKTLEERMYIKFG